MFRGFPSFMYLRSQRPSEYQASGLGWLVMVPGLGLIGAALAMIIWPELLAYVVAAILLCAGIVLTGAGWRMRRIEQRLHRDGTIPLHRHPYEPDEWAS